MSPRRPGLLGLFNPKDERDPITQGHIIEGFNLLRSKLMSQTEFRTKISKSHIKRKGILTL
jgi:hypothetical protein